MRERQNIWDGVKLSDIFGLKLNGWAAAHQRHEGQDLDDHIDEARQTLNKAEGYKMMKRGLNSEKKKSN